MSNDTATTLIPEMKRAMAHIETAAKTFQTESQSAIPACVPPQLAAAVVAANMNVPASEAVA